MSSPNKAAVMATTAPSSSAAAPPFSSPAAARLSVLDTNVSSPLPTAVIVIGMAGSGKTTLMQRLLSECSTRSLAPYSLNLDPAVTHLPYTPNIDIRDTVNYQQVQAQYNLGPNGGILTSLNLFATRFDQVLSFVDRRAPGLKYVLCDTPGQIEIFTWSASGVIISESLASSYPTVILYVIDTPRCQSPTTFMSNMLYACSIMYKSQLPFLLVFNKTDIINSSYVESWMADRDTFLDALAASPASSSYSATLTRSMSLVLDEFYNTLSHVAVSAVTGDGMDRLFAALDKARAEYYDSFLPALREKVERKLRADEERKGKMLQQLRQDMGHSGRRVEIDMARRRATGDDDTEEEDEAEEQDDAFEQRLAEHRDKADYEEFMRNIRSSHAIADETDDTEDEKKSSDPA